MFRIISLLLLFASFNLNAQSEYFPTENISDCTGAVELLHPGNYSVEFTKTGGLIADFIPYPQLKGIKEKNSLFFKFTAPFDGKLSLDAAINEGFLQLFIFQAEYENLINDILVGKATITRDIRTTTDPSIALSVLNGLNTLPSLDLQMDETIIIVFNTDKKYDQLLNFSLKYELKKDAENSNQYIKVVDERKDSEKSTFYIQIRDSETGHPVVADVNIKGRKQSNLYTGSDLYFSSDKYSRLTIKCDAPGYFFLDKTVIIYADSSKDINIGMRPVSKGKTLKIDKLEFVRGTTDIIPGTEMILTRVKDFLVLNAEIKIEIKGHVNSEGSESLTTKKLSKRRAKKIMHYLIDSGVNRRRLSFKACGNEFPIYLNPDNEKEAQANRRAEIKIL
jgi:flagellar motor protein MotB